MSGKSRAYILYFSIVAAFIVALILIWPALGNGPASAAAVCLLFGIVVGFRRVRENRDDPKGSHRFGTLVYALPKKWQQWMVEKD
jgi:hypothetical protein